MFSINNFFNSPIATRFLAPTAIIAGKDTRQRIGEIVTPTGIMAILVDQAFVDDPLIFNLRDTFDAPVISISGEPKNTDITNAISMAEGRDGALVAIGGGSTIDTAKAMAAMAAFGTYIRVGYEGLRLVSDDDSKKAPPVIAVPTTAGTGSETSRYYLFSNSNDGEKIVNRAWSLCPRYAILDPYFLERAPDIILTGGAFDTFIHLWETFICRQECSAFTDMVCLEGMARALAGIKHIRSAPQSARNDLQMASALGGIALSNTRTGIIHGAGEALAAQLPMAHPDTLMVFFDAAIEHYRGAIADRIMTLADHLHAKGLGGVDSLESIQSFWKDAFCEAGITERIYNSLKGQNIDRARIIAKILEDTVLIDKESPAPLDSQAVTHVVDRALDEFMDYH